MIMTNPNFFPSPYQPNAITVSGPAFSHTFRVFATILVLTLLAWSIRILLQNGLDAVDRTLLSWIVAGLSIILAIWWVILTSTTTITREHLTQTWIWKKSTPLTEIGYAKFIRIKGLEWLIAPRMYVRTGHGPFKTYYAGDSALWIAFEAMSNHFLPYKH